MGSIKRYVYLSTLLGIFSGGVGVQVGATIFAFYLVMLLNLLLVGAFLRPLVFPKWLVWFLLYLSASGIIGVMRGTDTPLLVAKQEVAIGLSVFYFTNFIRWYPDARTIWQDYARIAYLFSLVALLLWPVQCWIEHEVVRLQGLATEPAGFCVLTLPALYWYGYQWLTAGRFRRETLLIALAVALSVSSIGYSAVGVGLLLMFGRRIAGLSLAFAAVFLLGALLYTLSPDVSGRVDDTVSAIVNSDVSGTNLSTYALVSNMFVTERVFQVHPLLGNGLGSHVLSNQRYIEDVPGEDLIEASGWPAGANQQDAASLTLRSISELGLTGFLGILWFILRNRVSGKDDAAAISAAILTVFFQKLLRGGGYSNPEQFFFITMYWLNCRQADSRKKRWTISRTTRLLNRPQSALGVYPGGLA
jgi:hypothetical protein